MNVERCRSWLIIGSLILILLASAPTLALVVRLPSGSERFSELWLLGSGRMSEDYPFNIAVNEPYKAHLGVVNHLGNSAYCNIRVKFRNQTQSPPDPSSSIPSPLKSTCDIQFFLADDKTWEKLLIFSLQGQPAFVSTISINDVVFPIDCSSTWDQDYNGFYYQLFFELWVYNMRFESFQYQNRFVGIWLNVTE